MATAAVIVGSLDDPRVVTTQCKRARVPASIWAMSAGRASPAVATRVGCPIGEGRSSSRQYTLVPLKSMAPTNAPADPSGEYPGPALAAEAAWGRQHRMTKAMVISMPSSASARFRVRFGDLGGTTRCAGIINLSRYEWKS